MCRSGKRLAPGYFGFAGAVGLVLANACVPSTPADIPATASSPADAPSPSTTPNTSTSTDGSNGPAAPAMPGVNVPAIKVDTVGYPADWRKVAVLNVPPNDVQILTKQGELVQKIAPSGVREHGVDRASGDPVWQVEFSDLTRPGHYVLTAQGARSDAFAVAAPGRTSVYSEALMAAQKHFFFQRTRMPLHKPYATWKGDEYLRPAASHVHGDVGWDLDDYPEKKRRWKLEGGWHDAGNYDMYVPSTAPSAQALLFAYERHPALFVDGDLNIPESGNQVPDLLDEARWGLVWVLSMQEEKSGAFRHREAVMKWSPELPAHQDKTVRWVAGVSSAATAKAVSALATCARVYAKWDAAFAQRCEAASRKGWAWLERHPERIRVDGKGSPQPLWDDEPGRSDTGAQLMAATEVWRSFRLPPALTKIERLIQDSDTQGEAFVSGAWTNLSRWAMYGLATDAKTPDALRADARGRLAAAARGMRARVEKQDGYRCATPLDGYYWGHNSNLMERAHILLMAADLYPHEAWMVEAARDQWHWILGRNPNGYSMVTRIGKGPTRLYHMEWGKREPPPPGYLVGGPNAVEMKMLAPEAPAKTLLWDNPMPLRSGLPPHSLWHWQQSDLWDGGFQPENTWSPGWWAVTEPDIFYNANLVLVAAYMHAQAQK